MANCRAVLVRTDDEYQLLVDDIAAAINDQTRAIVTISPNNPTGAVFRREDLAVGTNYVSSAAYITFPTKPTNISLMTGRVTGLPLRYPTVQDTPYRSFLFPRGMAWPLGAWDIWSLPCT